MTPRLGGGPIEAKFRAQSMHEIGEEERQLGIEGFTAELQSACAQGRINVTFTDTSDDTNKNIQFTLEPVQHPPSPDVELAVALERLATAQKTIDRLTEVNSNLEEELQLDAGDSEPKVTEHHTRTIIHRRCWGSWVLAAVVATSIVINNHTVLENLWTFGQSILNR